MPAPAIPTPSAAPGFPAWYAGGWVDIERLLADYFAGLMSGVTCLTWLPPEKIMLQELQAGTIYLRVYRSGGHIARENDDGDVDRTHVQFAAMSASRDLSWEVIEFVRNTLYCFDGGGARMQTATLYAVIKCNGEILGPTLTPESFRDPRLVPVTFELETQRRKGLPELSEYRAALGL